MKKWIASAGIAAMLVAGGTPAFAATDNILGAVGNLVGNTSIANGSIVNATGPDFSIQAGSSYTLNQNGLSGLLGGVLGGSYNTTASLSGPNGLSASASTTGSYGLASSVQSLVGGLGGLLGGLLK